MSKLMDIVSVTKAYGKGRDKLTALSQVILSLSDGDFISIVGPSGAGKSTLLHVGGGLEPPDKGKVIFKGKDIYSLRNRELSEWRNKKVGFIFQFYHLIEELNVLENIAISAFKIPKKYAFKKAEELLKYLDIKGRQRAFPSQLSGGEKQRVAIARALINDPDLVFCDEPTGNLDHDSQQKVIELLVKLNKEKNKTIVLVTHNLELAKISNRILFIKDGNINIIGGTMKVYLNGKVVDKKDAKVSVFDHGYLYGDGVFEGIRVYNCLIFKLKEHVDRLYESAHSITLKVPMSKKALIDAIIKTLKANRLKDGYVRVIVSRGEGDLGLDPRKCKGHESVVIITDKIALYPKVLYDKGMDIISVPTVRNIPEALNPQIKSLNYLNNILAKIEAINSGYQEALMLDHLGYIAECTGDNIFVVKHGELYTPPQCMGTLRGITRDTVLDIAKKLKIPTHEHVLTRHELYISDECFLTGTAAEIVPVVKADGRTIGDAKPGKITKAITRDFKRLIKTAGTKYKI